MKSALTPLTTRLISSAFQLRAPGPPPPNGQIGVLLTSADLLLPLPFARCFTD